jgi:FAD/FMN-containing dehydrogenase
MIDLVRCHTYDSGKAFERDFLTGTNSLAITAGRILERCKYGTHPVRSLSSYLKPNIRTYYENDRHVSRSESIAKRQAGAREGQREDAKMTPGAIEGLKKEVRGNILRPTDAGYEEARRIYNAMINRRPAVIVRCAGKEDAAACVRYAREHDLPLSIRGGGHNVSGNAVAEGGVMLDMSNLKGIRVDAKTRIASADPGLTLGDYDKGTTPHELVTPLGIVSLTGIAGLTLGGGLGWLMGRFGLACDNLIGAEVVTADGKTVRASEKENPDLLWGLRGGGGNFGVVTEFQYRLHPLDPMLGGMLIHPIDKAKELLGYYREITRKLPDELVIYLGLLTAPDGNPVSALVLGYSGDPAQGEKVLAPIRAFGPPLADTIGPVSHVQQQSMLDQGYPAGQYHYWKTGFMDTLTDEAIDACVEQFMRRPSLLSQIIIEHMHGAASRVPATATAFAHRFDHYNVGGFGIWTEPKDNDTNLKWMEEFWQAVRPYTSGRAYVNYLGQEGASRVREAYGPNYDRLAALKKKYDPTNFFRLNQNIPPGNA